MKKSHSESPKSSESLSFPPHRRSHLKSQTYRTLVRILSYCYDESSCSDTVTPIVRQEPNPDNSSNDLGRATEKEMGEHGGSVSDRMGPGNTMIDESFEAVGFHDSALNDMQMANDEMDYRMRTEGNESLFNQNDIIIGENIEVNDFPNVEFSREQMLMDELEQIMKGNEELIQNSSVDLSTTSLEDIQGMVAVISNQEQVDPQQIVMDDQPGDAGQQRIDEENGCKIDMEALNLSVDTKMTTEASKPGENIEDQGSSLKTNEFEGEHEIQQEEMVLDKSMHNSGVMTSIVHTTEDKETEEGEISGDLASDDRATDLQFEEVVSKKKLGEEENCKGMIDKEIFSCNGQKRSPKKDSNSSSSFVVMVESVDNGREMTLEESVTKKLGRKHEIVTCGSSETRKDQEYNCYKQNSNKTKDGFDRPAACPNNLVYYGDILAENTTGDQRITSAEKDSGECNKKKRGRPSKERKEKKKQKERKKRAEKNRQLGVKRLKLQPVLKEKPLAHCRHYLKGRCQEGEKCKFSHDTVPLTKSKPCCHFARHSCMKGDDCPFDHQLSKYPCSNYVSKGFCSRGDDCMFSHKMLPEEASPAACKFPPLTDKSDSLKQSNSRGPSHQNVNSLSQSVGKCSSSKGEQSAAENLSKELAPKGISFLSVGKTSMMKTSMLKQGGSSPKRDDVVEPGNQTDQIASSTLRNVSETQKRTLPTREIPKGVNFLAFGKAPYGISSNKKVASLASNWDDTQLPLLDNHHMHKQVSTSANSGDSINVGSQISPKEVQNPNEMVKKTQRANLPLGMNFMAFEKSPSDDSTTNKQPPLSFSSDNSINRSFQEKQSAFPWRLPISLLASIQSADPLVLGYHKNTPNSANKALLSTLAFAAKYESEVKLKMSIAPPATTEANKETKINSNAGGLQNDLAKASRILNFLSSGGSDSKQ